MYLLLNFHGKKKLVTPRRSAWFPELKIIGACSWISRGSLSTTKQTMIKLLSYWE
jgi:hypothetical protein